MKRSISTLLVRTVLVGLLAGISPQAIAGQNVPATDPPGSLEAIEAATSIAAEKAAVEVMRGIPPGLDIIAVLPFLGDSEGMTTVTFEAALTTAARSRGIRLITRGSDEWSRIGAPVLDPEADLDAVPSKLLPRFIKDYPSGALIWGRLRYARIDESGLSATARIEVRASIPDTGEIAAFIGDGVAPIDTTTMAIGIGREWIGDPWFMPAVLCGAAAGVGIVIVLVLSRRRIARALKSRDLKN